MLELMITLCLTGLFIYLAGVRPILRRLGWV